MDHIYKLTPRAKQALSIAKKEAQMLKNKYAGTEHLLLGLLNIGDSVVIDILSDMDIDIDELRSTVYDNISQEGLEPVVLDGIEYTPRVEKIMDLAQNCAKKLDKERIDIEHIFLGLLYENDGIASSILVNSGVSLKRARSLIDSEMGSLDDEDLDQTPYDRDDSNVRNLKSLQKYGTDLTRLAAKNKIDPVIGREQEINRLIQILCRKTKNNPILLGEAGVGKTAVVEGLAQRIVLGKVPDVLSTKHIICLDLTLLVAGTKYRGQFEERVKQVLEDVKRNKDVIVFLDEIHMMVGAGSAEGTMDASNIFKPALARGEFRCIGATTPDEFRSSIESDPALERRFQPISVKEPNIQDSITILRGIRSSYEKFHRVKYTDDSLLAAVKLSKRYIPDRNLPDKAIDIIDEAGAVTHATDETGESIRNVKDNIKLARSKKENLIKGQQFEEACTYRDQEKTLMEDYRQLVLDKKGKKKEIITIDKKDIEHVVTTMTNIPVSCDDQTYIDKILDLKQIIKTDLIGQDGAVSCICESLKRSVANIQDPDRPVGSFLFLGSTGVGKTYLAKLIAETVFEREESFIQIDMSEMMEQHSVSKLIGSPPGYIGSDRGGGLTEKIKRDPYSLVLFDEIEKASPDVLHILLQILEEGKLTDSSGRAVSFKNAIIVMTTNIGAEKIAQPLPMGFKTPTDDEKIELIHSNAIEEVRAVFRPEFINRIDEMIVFNPLVEDDIRLIVDINFKKYINRIYDNHGVTITLHDKARELFAKQGYSDKYGARELNRTIQRLFETAIADKLLRGTYVSGDKVLCTVKGEKVLFKKQSTREKNRNP